MGRRQSLNAAFPTLQVDHQVSSFQFGCHSLLVPTQLGLREQIIQTAGHFGVLLSPDGFPQNPRHESIPGLPAHPGGVVDFQEQVPWYGNLDLQ